MANPAPSSDPFADRRAYPRVEIALPALLQAGSKRHAVQLLDLSAGGAKLNCPLSLPTGTEVMLDCGTLGLRAIVRWQNGGVMGLSFDSELDARDVKALVDRSAALTARMKTRK